MASKSPLLSRLFRTTSLALLIFAAVPAARADDTEAPSAPEGKPTTRHSDSIVIIDGDKGTGTGFVCEIRESVFVVTNLHVLSGNTTFTLRTASGKRLSAADLFGAVGHDIAILRIREGSRQPTPLPFEPEIHRFVDGEDDIVVLGNSEGRGTILRTLGKLVGLGPSKIEIDNPVYPGNSGSPILHEPTGRVIGVVSHAEQAGGKDFVTEASREDERSAVKGDVRYFGFRLDSVEKWERIDWARFREEAAVLDAFSRDSEAIRSFLFDDEEHFLDHAELKRGYDELRRRLSHRSHAQIERVHAVNRFIRQLTNFVTDGVTSLEQQKNRFYDHHRLRAEDEIAHRQELEKAVQAIRSDFRHIERRIRR